MNIRNDIILVYLGIATCLDLESYNITNGLEKILFSTNPNILRFMIIRGIRGRRRIGAYDSIVIIFVIYLDSA